MRHIPPLSPIELHQLYPFHSESLFVVYVFSQTIYLRGLKFLRVIYESFDSDLTQEIFYGFVQQKFVS